MKEEILRSAIEGFVQLDILANLSYFYPRVLYVANLGCSAYDASFVLPSLKEYSDYDANNMEKNMPVKWSAFESDLNFKAS